MNRDPGMHLPILVVLDKKDATDYSDLTRWFNDSRYVTYEASDLLDAVEEICDFTVKDCPDVILLKVNSIGVEYSAIVQMVHHSQASHELPILAYSNNEQYPSSVQNLRQLKSELQKIVPRSRFRSRSANA
jgi:PleD family two-component response regulator